MIRIILVRHGRTAWNVSGASGPRFRGIVDVPLAGEGAAQAERTAQRLAAEPLAAVYSSPLQRAARTAEIIAEPHGLAVQTRPGLSSMDYGLWAGRDHAEVAKQWPDLYRRWHEDPFSVQAPGGEHPGVLRERAVAALHEILAAHADGDTLALVSHQAVTRTLICVLAGLPDGGYWAFRQDLCNLSRFDYDPASKRFRLVGLNDVCHLASALPRAGGDGTRLVLVRHGQTGWNAQAGQERFRGRADGSTELAKVLPLDETGRAQARAVARRLQDEPLAALYASPLLRARQTLEPLGKARGQKIQPHDGLLDIDYGQLQGQRHADAADAYPELYSQWRTAPGRVQFPGGEGLRDVQRRVLAFLDEVTARHPGQTVVGVGHQIVNKVLICSLLGLSLDAIWRVEQDTAGIDVFQQVAGRWQTLGLNDSCHLA